MNTKQNEKFFTKNNLLVYISIAIMVLGGACFFKRWLIAIGCVILAIGAALFIVFSAKRVSEKEVRACLERKLEGMDYSFDTLGVNERRVIRTIAPLVTEYFEYDEEKELALLREAECMEGFEQGLERGLEQGLRTLISSLKKFCPDVDELYSNVIANSDYANLTREEFNKYL